MRPIKTSTLFAAAAALTFGNRWFRTYLDLPAQGAPTAPVPPAAPASGSPPPVQQQTAPAPFDSAPLLAAVREAVQTQLAPVQQAQAALTERVNALAAPNPQAQAAASRLFGAPGAAPAIRQGEDPLTSRGYQYFRAMGLRQGVVSQQNAKVEWEMHQRLHSHMQGLGFRPESDNSILVPLWADAIPELPDSDRQLLRQSVAQGVNGADPREIVRMQRQRAMAQGMSVQQTYSQFDETGLGVFVQPTLHGDLIELLRAREVFSRAGATQFPLPPNGRLRLPAQTGAATAYWVGESTAITASQQTSGSVDLIAKKLAALCKLPNELIQYGNPSVEAFVRADLVRVLALEADAAMLAGVASTVKPKGLITYSGITTHVATVTGTDGNTFQPEDAALMVAKVEEQNHDIEGMGFSWVMRPLFWSAIANKRAEVYNGSTTVAKGEWMFSTSRDALGNAIGSNLNGYPVVKSTQVPNNRTKGSGTGLHLVLGGVFAHWLIGRVGVAEFATSTQGDTPFTTDQSWVRVIQHIDAAPRYQNAFAMCDTLVLA